MRCLSELDSVDFLPSRLDKEVTALPVPHQGIDLTKKVFRYEDMGPQSTSTHRVFYYVPACVTECSTISEVYPV